MSASHDAVERESPADNDDVKLYAGAVLLARNTENTLLVASCTALSENEARGAMVARTMADYPGWLLLGITVSKVSAEVIALVAGHRALATATAEGPAPDPARPGPAGGDHG